MYGEHYPYHPPPPLGQYFPLPGSSPYVMMPAATPIRYIPPGVQFAAPQQANAQELYLPGPSPVRGPSPTVIPDYQRPRPESQSPKKYRNKSSEDGKTGSGSSDWRQRGRGRGSPSKVEPKGPGFTEARSDQRKTGNKSVNSPKIPNSDKVSVTTPSSSRERGILHLKQHSSGPRLSDFIPEDQSAGNRRLRVMKKIDENAPQSKEEWPSLNPEGHSESGKVQKSGSEKSGEKRTGLSSQNGGVQNTKSRKTKSKAKQTDSELKDKNDETVNENIKISYVDKVKAPPKPPQSKEPDKVQNWRDQRTKVKKGELQKKLKNGLKNTEDGSNGSESKTVEIGNKVSSKNEKIEETGKQKGLEKEKEGAKIKESTTGASEAVRAKRRARRAVVRARKKDQKEAEKLLEIRKPKDSKVTVLSGKVLEKYLKATSSHQKKAKGFKVEAGEFPELVSANPETPVGKRTLADVVKQENVVKDVFVDEDNVWNEPPSEPPPVEEKKAPKPRDPIEFNLFDIAMAKSVMKMRKKEQKKSATQNIKRRVDTDKIIANTLDANAPILSRGKIRTKPKKPSLMKRAILRQRQERQKLLAVSAGMVAASSRPSETRDTVADDEWSDQEGGEESGKVVVVKTERKKKKKEKKLEPEINEPVSHNRRFREYCDQMLTDDIDSVCVDLLHDLVRFQDRAHQKDPIKAKMRKRLVFGLREVTRQVERGRVKAVIVAPNLERCSEPGGLDDAVKVLLDRVREKNLFCVYALDRWRLSRATKKRGMTSCLGILNYQGSDENYKKLVSLVNEARGEYERRRPKEVTDSANSLDSAAQEQESAGQPDVGVNDKAVSNVLLSLLKAEIKD